MASTLVVDHAKVERWSSLGRDIDPSVPSNRLAIAGALIAALVAGLTTLFGLQIDIGPVSAAIAVFLSWAIARELDPDNPASAAIAMPVSLVLLVLLGPSSLLVSTGVLLGLRMTAGTVGTSLRPLDILGIVALAALLGTSTMGLVGVAAMGVGVLVDEPRRERGMAIVAAAATAFVVTALITEVSWSWTVPNAAGWATLAIGAVATLWVVPAESPTSSTDRSPALVRRARLTSARVAAGSAVVGAFAVSGDVGIVALAGTAIAALMGTAIALIAGGLHRAPSARQTESATSQLSTG